MYAVMITFDSSVPIDDLADEFLSLADALRGVPGLLSKTWIHDDKTVGGFHVFADQRAAQDYLTSDLPASLTGDDRFDNFHIDTYWVLDDLSASTGIRSLAPLTEMAR